MHRHRKVHLALGAWILPLLLLASNVAQAATMFCSMQGALVRSGCCCSPVPVAADSDESSHGFTVSPHAAVRRQACCEAGPAAAKAALAEAVRAPAFDLALIEPLRTQLCLVIPPPAAPSPLRERGSCFIKAPPLILLKHAFLV